MVITSGQWLRFIACMVFYGSVLTGATKTGAASVDCWRLVLEQI